MNIDAYVGELLQSLASDTNNPLRSTVLTWAEEQKHRSWVEAWLARSGRFFSADDAAEVLAHNFGLQGDQLSSALERWRSAATASDSRSTPTRLGRTHDRDECP